MSVRWLLVLGSDAEGGAPIAATLEALAELGPVEPLTGPRRSRDDDGNARWFTNRLVRLECALDRAALRERLQEIERDIGRSERRDDVPIDIDLLASSDGNGWHLDPYAAEKGEHKRPHVLALLHEANITLSSS